MPEAEVITPTPTPTPAPWYQGKVDADVLQVWQNKNYDLNDPAKVASELTKAYREAESKLGTPSDRIIKLPVDPSKDTDGMKAIFQRLGMPLDKKDYDFPALKNEKGEVTNVPLADALRETSANAFLTKEAAAKVADAVAKFNKGQDDAKAVELAAALKTEHDTLAKNWGANAATNKVIAQNAAAALKVSQAEVDALEKVVGYARVMELFRQIGTKIGEDKFLRAEGPGGQKIASVDEAKARLVELKQDQAWGKRYLDGDTAARREMHDLMVIISGSSG